METIQKVQEQVLAEYQAFKKRMLQLSAEEVYNHCYEIHVKIELYEVIMENCLSDELYDNMALFGDGLLDYLYNDFINTEYASVNTFDDTEDFIEDSIKYWMDTRNGGDSDGNV